jgi:DNA-binding PadR family transcriptional regulator
MNLQRAITELVDTGFVTAKSKHNRTYLTITAEGQETLAFFKNRIDTSLKQEIDEFLHINQFKLRNETSVLTDYGKVLSGDYEVHLTVKEKDVTVVEVTLSVPNEETAEAVCLNWKKKNQDIYQYLIGQLF